MSLAVVLGGAACVWDDLAALEAISGPWPGIVVAVNDAGAAYPGRLHHWATLHPEKLPRWRKLREERGGNTDYATWGRPAGEGVDRALQTRMAGGSSGLYAVEVALRLGCTRIVLCGVPMEPQGHFFDAIPWDLCLVHRLTWRTHAGELWGTVRSMSGWTRDLLDAPDAEWLQGESTPEVRSAA